MHLSENEGIDGNIFVVTGGLGFVGSALCLELVRRGAREVRSLDVKPASTWSDELKRNGVVLIQGDISKKKDVDKAIRGADCVFHVASFGMSGKEMLQAGRVDQVNINGTCAVLDACHGMGVRRLVYVSTYNVVFGGKEILNGNEALPYYPVEGHVDPYGCSKAVAEQMVLKSNGSLSKKTGRQLYTCAVRPAAIYGPGEERHLPRILSLAKLGLLTFKIDSPNLKADWVYVDNLVLALILASMGLLDDIPGREGRPVAAGQAYFISDGCPVNSYEFLINPLLRSLGYDVPKHNLSVQTALALAKFFWVFYSMLYPLLNRSWLPQPLILPAEVYKIGVTHYFSFLKAKQELGYIPMISHRDGLDRTISYWQDRKRRELDGPSIYSWLFAVIGMTLLFIASFLPPYGPFKAVHAVSLFVFRSMWTMQVVFLISMALHIGEGLYAWRLAKKVDPPNAKGWFWQTFLLGFFSLRYLLKRARSHHN